MSGLAGLVGFRGAAPDPDVLARVAGRVVHRGRDGQGVFREGPVALAHRLHSVEHTPAQPLVDDDLVILVDGRIYDRDEVLRAAGHEGPVDSDVEAIRVGWRRWGADVASHLDGHFAIALWDRTNQTLFLMRDRMGIRPLFWARSGGLFAFASELPALLEVPWIGRELAREHVAEYLSFRVVHAPRTLLRDVHQVEPAHWLRLNSDELQTRRYWTPAYAPPGTPRPRESEVVRELAETVDRAVRRRLRGDPEAGLYLSGGLGSTAIAAAARRMHRQLPTFTVSFADDPFPEAPFAGRVARLLGMQHHDVLVGTPEVANAFYEVVRVMGHPVGNPASILQIPLARAAAEHVRVVLSGDGVVELFGGRMLDSFARDLRFATLFSRLPRPTRAMFGRALALSRRGERLTAPIDRYGLALAVGGSDLFTARERTGLLQEPVLARPMVRHDVLGPVYAGLDTDPFNAVLHAYQRSWLMEDSLVRADRIGADRGLAPRFPLLDREVVELAARLPGSFKVRRVAGGSLHTRWLLHDMLSGVLPTPLLTRPKRGMPTPLDGWLSGPGRLFFEERFARLKRDPQRLWKPEALDGLRRGLVKTEGAAVRLWALFLLDAWIESLG